MHPAIPVTRTATPAPPAAPRQPRLLDRLREALRVHNYTLRTEQAYVTWAERFIHFHGERHPGTLDEADIACFLRHLVIDRETPPALQNQAFAALLFLYRDVLRRELDWRRVITRTRRPRPLRHHPVVSAAGTCAAAW
jgi:hypothetical protein